MASFTKQISFRWSDLDPNFHVRHSAYYDFGAQHRIEILEELGLTLRVMQTQGFGPVLFREEKSLWEIIHVLLGLKANIQIPLRDLLGI